MKHYVREGLLPGATKTHRNMAYYPPEAVDRIRVVKELQEKRYLPLRVIKALLGRDGCGHGKAREAFEAMRGTLSEASERLLGGSDAVARASATALAGITKGELAALEAAGVVSRGRADQAYDAVDSRLLAILGELRRAGFTRRRGFGADLLSIYARAVDSLADEEVSLFLSHVLERVPADAARPMLAAAFDRIGELIVLLRRKALVRKIEDLGARLG